MDVVNLLCFSLTNQKEYHMAARPSRRERRQQKDPQSERQPTLSLANINPLTENQHKAFKEFDNDQNLILHGSPGTGKSFISLYLALDDFFNGKNGIQKVVIIRSAQASKNIGFLPGTAKQKMEVYESPYVSICTQLFGRGDAYSILKQKGIVEFESTSFLRGMTIDNAIIIIDEGQNSNFMELKTVLTRVGENTRVIVCGDTKQDDLTSARFSEESGLPLIIRISKKMESISLVEFSVNDIVRSGFVKEFIIAELEIAA